MNKDAHVRYQYYATEFGSGNRAFIQRSRDDLNFFFNKMRHFSSGFKAVSVTVVHVIRMIPIKHYCFRTVLSFIRHPE